MYRARRLSKMARLALIIVGVAGVAALVEAATGTLFVKLNKVGIGTDTPAHLLHVFDDQGKTFIVAENQGTGTDSVAVLRSISNTAGVNFQAHGGNRTLSRFGKSLGGWAEFLQWFGNGLIIGTLGSTPLVLGTGGVSRLEIGATGNIGIGTLPTANPIQHATGAVLSGAGVWTDASSRSYKRDIQELSAAEALAAFEQLAPVRYRHKGAPEDEALGFIAEDVPELVATADRKGLSAMDIAAVLTKVVQEQNALIEQLSKRVALLEGAAETD